MISIKKLFFDRNEILQLPGMLKFRDHFFKFLSIWFVLMSFSFFFGYPNHIINFMGLILFLFGIYFSYLFFFTNFINRRFLMPIETRQVIKNKITILDFIIFLILFILSSIIISEIGRFLNINILFYKIIIFIAILIYIMWIRKLLKLFN